MKKALITGITGQDGSYLAEFLVKEQYQVFGLVRRVAIEDSWRRFSRIRRLLEKKLVTLKNGSLEDFLSLCLILQEIRPDEIYHLGAQSFVMSSFFDGNATFQTNILGTHNLLTAVQQIVPKAKFYFAGSSEMFGKVEKTPQDEGIPFHPCSPYGISKVAGFHLTQYFRESHGLFAVSGILFNHESPRRGYEFVTRKISRRVAEIKLGLVESPESLGIGNLDAKRDWGYAPEYVEAMYLMMQHHEPSDFVIATGETHSIRELIQKSFACVGINVEWKGVGVSEIGLNAKNGKILVRVDASNFRPLEVSTLTGNCSKAKEELGWKPEVKFDRLVEIMVEHDLKELEQEKKAGRI